MPAARNIDIYRGDDLIHTVTIVDAEGAPVNLTGRTYASQLRRYPDTEQIAATFDVDATQANVGLLILSIDGDVTATLDPGPYRYDLEQTQGGTRTTLLAGEAIVTADVTRLPS